MGVVGWSRSPRMDVAGWSLSTRNSTGASPLLSELSIPSHSRLRSGSCALSGTLSAPLPRHSLKRRHEREHRESNFRTPMETAELRLAVRPPFRSRLARHRSCRPSREAIADRGCRCRVVDRSRRPRQHVRGLLHLAHGAQPACSPQVPTRQDGRMAFPAHAGSTCRDSPCRRSAGPDCDTRRCGTVTRLASRRVASPFVALDCLRCGACWKCIGVLPESVFGKIHMWGRRYFVVAVGDRCLECRRCVKGRVGSDQCA